MKIKLLLSYIDGTQQIEITESATQKKLYSGTVFDCLTLNYDVIAIYTKENKIIIEV